MRPSEASGLNETGEDGETTVVRAGAAHLSRSQHTTQHAHYAWKIHIGIDAPVWVRRHGRARREETRVLIVPPNVPHATGAVGWSVALFVEPGTRGAPWRETGEAHAAEGARMGHFVRLGEQFARSRPCDLGAIIDDVARKLFDAPTPAARVDARVRAALLSLERNPDLTLPELAASLRISVDRLTHLVSAQTGIPPRRHVLWQRVLRVLDAGSTASNLATAALDAGFADHAHLTRTFRRFLGRAPSEFRAPPRVLARWTGDARGTRGP